MHIYIYIYLFIYLFIYLSIYLSIFIFTFIFIFQFIFKLAMYLYMLLQCANCSLVLVAHVGLRSTAVHGDELSVDSGDNGAVHS